MTEELKEIGKLIRLTNCLNHSAEICKNSSGMNLFSILGIHLAEVLLMVDKTMKQSKISPACRSGGTGRRAAFRAQFPLRECGFDSHLRHHNPSIEIEGLYYQEYCWSVHIFVLKCTFLE